MELNEKIIKRFMAKVNKTDSCWLWTAGCFSNGYGHFMLKALDSWKAHRISYIIHKGDIPEGMKVLHKCDNKKCVNPEHLFLGTQADNIKDMLSKDRQKLFYEKTVCLNGHDCSSPDSRYKNGNCKQCERDRLFLRQQIRTI